MKEEATHHIESLIAAVEGMFDRQASGRSINKEEWFLARDHAKAAADELQAIRDGVERRNVKPAPGGTPAPVYFESG